MKSIGYRTLMKELKLTYKIHAGYVVVHTMNVETVGGSYSIEDELKSIDLILNKDISRMKLLEPDKASDLVEKSL
jgi:hypothetical protein